MHVYTSLSLSFNRRSIHLFIFAIIDDEIFVLLRIRVAFSNHHQVVAIALFDAYRIALQQSYALRYQLRRQEHRILYWLPS